MPFQAVTPERCTEEVSGVRRGLEEPRAPNAGAFGTREPGPQTRAIPACAAGCLETQEQS